MVSERLGPEDAVGNLVGGAVAACRRHDGEALQRGGQRQLLRVAGSIGGAKSRAVAEDAAQLAQALPAAAPSGSRVINHADGGRGHGVSLVSAAHCVILTSLARAARKCFPSFLENDHPMTHTGDGLLVLDKPGGLTSRAALDRAARWFPRRTRIGHTGTLDPLATGVLVLCIGNATRLTEYIQDMGKTYRSRFRLGACSDTDDADGKIAVVSGATAPDTETVAGHLADFVGTIKQVPPAYSAAKVTGRRAYDLARSGTTVVLAPRPVRVYAIDVIHYEYPVLDVEVRCGKARTFVAGAAISRTTRLRGLCRDIARTRRPVHGGKFRISGCTPRCRARSRLLPVEAAVAGVAAADAAGRSPPFLPGTGRNCGNGAGAGFAGGRLRRACSVYCRWSTTRPSGCCGRRRYWQPPKVVLKIAVALNW